MVLAMIGGRAGTMVAATVQVLIFRELLLNLQRTGPDVVVVAQSVNASEGAPVHRAVSHQACQVRVTRLCSCPYAGSEAI